MTTSARIIAPLVIALLTLLGADTPIPVWAEEPTSIQAILEEPRDYHLRHVTLRGIARDVQPLEPYPIANGDNCYGAYLFRLEDDEATIPVAVLGICGRPFVRDPEVEPDVHHHRGAPGVVHRHVGDVAEVPAQRDPA